jgi:hypothetical protein
LRAAVMSFRLMVVPASSGQMARHKDPVPVKTRISAMSRGSYRMITLSPT